MEDSSNKTSRALHSVAHTIAHPRKTIKRKVKRSTAWGFTPVDQSGISKKKDVELVDAYDDLSRAESKQMLALPRQGAKAAVSRRQERIVTLETERKISQVEWATSHINRVRVVSRSQIQPVKGDSFREWWHGESQIPWKDVIGHNVLLLTQEFSAYYIDDINELPFDIDTVRKHTERLVMVSAPWQAWAMSVRKVYRWDDPKNTGRWLALYVVLWYTEHLIGFVWLYICYVVIRNRYFNSSLESIQDSVARSDNESTPWQLGELIEKYGREKWMDPLLDQLGPFLQLQLYDIANLLEIMENFYMWKSPFHTTGSLLFLVSCLSLSLFTNTKYCMKIFWFSLGCYFFLCSPISSRYPKYRYLVSPMRWILWNIPTHAELSLYRLREEAQKSREILIERKVETTYNSEPTLPRYAGSASTPLIDDSGDDYEDTSEEEWHSASSSDSVLEGADMKAFHGQSQGVPGKLIVYSAGVRFVRSFRHKELWNIPFVELSEMRKEQASALSKVLPTSKYVPTSKIFPITSRSLEFDSTGNRGTYVVILKERDEAFKSIIGSSNLRWQPMQSIPKDHADRSKIGDC